MRRGGEWRRREEPERHRAAAARSRQRRHLDPHNPLLMPRHTCWWKLPLRADISRRGGNERRERLSFGPGSSLMGVKKGGEAHLWHVPPPPLPPYVFLRFPYINSCPHTSFSPSIHAFNASLLLSCVPVGTIFQLWHLRL